MRPDFVDMCPMRPGYVGKHLQVDIKQDRVYFDDFGPWNTVILQNQYHQISSIHVYDQ